MTAPARPPRARPPLARAAATAAPRPGAGGRPAAAGAAGRAADDSGPPRPLAVTGTIAACAAAGSGLAALTLLAAAGWIAAPHASLGGGLPGVLRTAIQLWLVAHHVGFYLRGTGHVGMLPLGLVLLPGALLWRSGRWVVRTGRVDRLRHVGYAALALALPYGVLAGALAVASRTPVSAPSAAQAAGAGFLLALAAGGLGGARALAPWARLIALLPDRVRCLVVGLTGSLAVLTAAGSLLVSGSLVAHMAQFRATSDELAAGPVGSALLLLATLAYLPNAVIWAIAYLLGPGFAFGTGTLIAPTGAALARLPLFPLLAALPGRSTVPGWAAAGLLAVPFLSGAFGGLLTVRTAPSPTIEAAPVWGFACGALGGCTAGALAAFSGGPLGTGRLAAVGPSGWQVALVASLEMGVAAAIVAGMANWLLIRRRRRAAALRGAPQVPEQAADPPGHLIVLTPPAQERAVQDRAVPGRAGPYPAQPVQAVRARAASLAPRTPGSRSPVPGQDPQACLRAISRPAGNSSDSPQVSAASPQPPDAPPDGTAGSPHPSGGFSPKRQGAPPPRPGVSRRPPGVSPPSPGAAPQRPDGAAGSPPRPGGAVGSPQKS